MNHRTGKLTMHDFDPSHDAPAPSWFIGPIGHTSDFGVIDGRETFKQPARRSGPNPPRVSASERAWLILGAFVAGWFIASAVGMSL